MLTPLNMTCLMMNRGFELCLIVSREESNMMFCLLIFCRDDEEITDIKAVCSPPGDISPQTRRYGRAGNTMWKHHKSKCIATLYALYMHVYALLYNLDCRISSDVLVECDRGRGHSSTSVFSYRSLLTFTLLPKSMSPSSRRPSSRRTKV